MAKRGTLKLLSTFTCQPIKEYMEFWGKKLGLDYGIKIGPYNQIFQEILSAYHDDSRTKTMAEIFLIRIEDWGQRGKDSTIDKNLIEESFSNFWDILSKKQDEVLRIVCIMPPSPKHDPEKDYFEKIEEKVQSYFERKRNIICIPSRKFTEKCSVYYDSYSDEQANIPYVQAMYANAATIIFRKIFAYSKKPLKVVVLDCDNTMWSGVCAEDGPLGIKISEPYEQLQRVFLSLYQKGVLLCICSKNNEKDVINVFKKNKNMILQQEHFVCMKINWNSKYENIGLISKELNLNLADFVFVDDNPVECAEMESNLPQVLTLNLPSDSNKIPSFLENTWYFDILDSQTKEDANRTALYKAEAERKKFQADFKSLREFIGKLDLSINQIDYESQYLSRLSQLTYRVNQFNFTSKRYSEKALSDLVEKGYEVKIADVSDKFGDYGIVGMVIFYENPPFLEIDSFLLSCRVLGRGVEFKLLSDIGSIAKERQIELVKLFFKPTERNEEVVKFFKKIGITDVGSKEDFFAIDADIVSQLSFENYLKSVEGPL